MWMRRLRATIPHLAVLVVAGILYQLATTISFTPRPGQLGPDFWPKLALGLIAGAALLEIIRRLTSASPEADVRAVVDTLTAGTGEGEAADDDAQRSPWLLAAGIALITAYALLVSKLGFLLSSFGFLVIFMYLGGMRRHRVIWATSAIAIVVFAFVFLKVVYVSIPRGEPPFDQATQFVMDLLLIK